MKKIEINPILGKKNKSGRKGQRGGPVSSITKGRENKK